MRVIRTRQKPTVLNDQSNTAIRSPSATKNSSITPLEERQQQLHSRNGAVVQPTEIHRVAGQTLRRRRLWKSAHPYQHARLSIQAVHHSGFLAKLFVSKVQPRYMILFERAVTEISNFLVRAIRRGPRQRRVGRFPAWNTPRAWGNHGGAFSRAARRRAHAARWVCDRRTPANAESISSPWRTRSRAYHFFLDGTAHLLLSNCRSLGPGIYGRVHNRGGRRARMRNLHSVR